MNYINPYELLNLSSTTLSDIDSVSIRKAKTALFRQIDLNINDNSNRGYVEYRGTNLTKEDCKKVIDDLDDKNKKDFHSFIYQNKSLNDFLSDGSLNFFDNYKVESIYKLSAFIDFISPFFSEQYNKISSEYFEKWDTINATKILSISPLVNAAYLDKCYSKVRLFLRGIIDKVNELKKKIEDDNEFIDSDSFEVIYILIIKSINTKLINLLPHVQFQSIRNTLGGSIQQLAVTVHNIEYDKSDNDKTKNLSQCFHLTEVAKEIDCTGLEEKQIRDSYFIQKKHSESQQAIIELEKKKPLLNKYSQLKDLIVDKIDEVDNEKTTPEAVKSWMNSALNIIQINQLDPAFIETKNGIALLLKSLSVSIWNKQDDIDIALFVLSKGMAINADEATKSKLLTAKVQLDELKSKIEKQKELNRQRLSAYKPKEKSSFGVVVGIVVIILIIYLISNSNSSSNNYTNNNSFNPSNNSYVPPVTADTSSSDINSLPLSNSNSSINNHGPIAPIYTRVSMKDGNIPNCSGIIPKFDYSIDNKLIISAQFTDVAVKLINYETDNCIRFVFINDGTTYSVKHIPEGKYYLKIAYGNDWSVAKGDPVCKGHFTSNVSYKRDYSNYDFNKIYHDDGRVSVPYYTLRLYTTYSSNNNDDNSAGSSISEADFNN